MYLLQCSLNEFSISEQQIFFFGRPHVVLLILFWLRLPLRLIGDTAFKAVGIACPHAGRILYQQQAARTSPKYEPASQK